MNAVASGVAGEFRAESEGEHTVEAFGEAARESAITNPFAVKTGRTTISPEHTPELAKFFSTVSKKVNDIKELKALLPKYQSAHENLVLLLDAFIQRLHSNSLLQKAAHSAIAGIPVDLPLAEGEAESPAPAAAPAAPVASAASASGT